MIVRLMGEGQWRVDDSLRARIDELDTDTEHVVAAGDEQALQAALRALHELVRRSGEQLDHATSEHRMSSCRRLTSASTKHASSSTEKD